MTICRCPLVRIDIAPQPDDRTCGATCLHALYRHAGDRVGLPDVINDVPQLADGGTLGVHLAIDALRRGYDAEIFTYNLQIFDPSWFHGGVDIDARLARQAEVKTDPRVVEATPAYRRFLSLGGRLRLEEFDIALFERLLRRGPLLVGLSATYLYRSMREVAETDTEDDVRGTPVGHFVLLEQLDRRNRELHVADPWRENPMASGQHYVVPYDRLTAAILLSIVTYDSNLVSITKREEPR